MAKKYWDGPYDINTDWGGDESTNNLPLLGGAVQNIVKDELKRKVGYLHESYEDGMVYFYSSKEAYENGEIPIGSVVSTARYTMDLKGDVNNKNMFLSTEGKKEFVWYFKTIEIATKSAYVENVAVEYTINNETEGKQTIFSTIIDCNGDVKNDDYTKVVLNLDEYLSNGTSSIEIVVRGLKTKQERTLQTKISIITLDMEDTTNFSSPSMDNLILTANVNCTNGQLYFCEYRIDENVNGYILTDDNYTGKGSRENVQYFINLNELTLGKHICEYRLFVNINNEIYRTNTQRIEFIKGNEDTHFDEPQILIFSSYNSAETPKAEDGNLIIHGVSQYVPYTVKYAVYNTNGSSTNMEFYEIVNDEESAPLTDSVSNNVFAEYNVQSIEHGIKKVKIITKDIDGNITNGNGRIIYLNVEQSDLTIGIYDTNLRIDFSSVGKSNNSVDKETWKSVVAGGRYVNNASFNETYDWSQGWTDNGLVVSEGCEVTFDYTPFPMQKSNASAEEANEYVGGDKAYSFEIEFMTQNVTNEDAIVCDMMDEGGSNCGLQITGSQIKFTTPNGESVSTRFKAEEMNRATIVIRPKKTSTGAFKGLVELYVNGVLSNITKYTESEQFVVMGKDAIGNSVSKYLTFKGTEGADIVIKYIRAYNGAMESDNVVNNYILYRTNSKEMLNLYNKNNVVNDEGLITPQSIVKLGNIPLVIFIGRTNPDELATGDGNKTSDEEYKPGKVDANEENWYKTLEDTTNKKKNVDMDVIYYNPLDKSKNFKFIKAYITPQGTSSMYYPKKNYRIYTQKNKDTRCFFSNEENGALELEQMLRWDFGENPEDRVYEKWRGTDNYKKRKYSFKNNSQAVKCWCLKADFAETSSSHNTGVARLWGDTLKNSAVSINNKQVNVFKTNAQTTTEENYRENINEMPDVRTTIDGFPIVVFGAKSYSDKITFLGKYNFNNDKSTESVFGFCDIDNEKELTDTGKNTETEEISQVKHTLDDMLDQYMTCVETLDNGNALANFSTLNEFDDKWEDAFEFRYPEIPEAPDESDYKDSNENWVEGGEEDYNKDYNDYVEDLEYWKNTHLKPFRHFAQWLYDTRWCDVNGNILEGLTEEEAMTRKEKFAKEKWEHLDVWKMAAYYIYTMRFGAVDQIVKNSMLTSEGPFAYNREGNKNGYWDTTDVASENYGKYYKWYYINYDNDTVLGVKNDGSLAYGPEITRKMKEGEGETASYIYAGSDSTLWNNFDADEEFQEIVRIADQGISKTMTYKKAIDMFDVEQVGKWCERIYNKDADYKYVSPYVADWSYTGDDDNAENFTDKLFMLQGSRTAHRRWWMSKRFNLFDGKWSSGDFATKYIEVKCDYGSIGDKFSAVAGANAYFGYQINNKTFGGPEGGENVEYKAYDNIDWVLKKNIQIGDPIAIYGSTDMLELNLMGLSKNLSSVLFYFGNNSDISNKLERLILSVPDELLIADSSYKIYSDDEKGTVNGMTGFEKLQKAYPSIVEADFEEGGKYPTSEQQIEATDPNSPDFYRSPVTNDEGEVIYTYFAKVSGGIRNNSCKGVSFDALDKLQVLKMAGYNGVSSINLTNNKFINTVDTRYSNINNVTFAEGARIKEFKASDALNTLAFNRCNNIKLSDIMINSTLLEANGGTYINKIEINNSDGLNHDNNFKSFILKWIKNGVISNKSLVLKGIKWTNVNIQDIEALLAFKEGNEMGVKAQLCELSGIIEMSNANLSRANIETIERLKNTSGMDLNVKIPTNILIDCPESMVAGQTIIVGCTLFPDEKTIIEAGGTIEFAFVKEITTDEVIEGMLTDTYTGKRYIIISDVSEIRNGSVTLEQNNRTHAVITTTEIETRKDTTTLIAAILRLGGVNKFDVTQLIIKEPTYAVRGSISGLLSLNDKGRDYTYVLDLVSNKNDNNPIGTVDIIWELEGEGVNFISHSAVSKDNKTLTITTDSYLTPERIAMLNIKVNVNNYNLNYNDFTLAKEVSILNENIIMTRLTNEVIMDRCYRYGLSTDPDAMTREEAAKVEDISTIFSEITTNCTFDEFAYFINEKLTTLDEGAFKNSKITSITLPNNITTLGKSCFEGCNLLETIKLTENIKGIIPERAFLGCSSLKNFELPEQIHTISKFAFGGVGFEIMAFKGEKTTTPKTIFVGKESGLQAIMHNAFESNGWILSSDSVKTTNVLREVSLPKALVFDVDRYNFLLSNNLEKINLVEGTNLYMEDNILYATSDKAVIIRALTNSYNVIPSIELTNVNYVYDYAFYNCNCINSLVFTFSLGGNSLGAGAFFNSGLKAIDLSASTNLLSIKDYTFNNCKELVSVFFPGNEGSLHTLGANLFLNSENLKEIKLPDTVVKINKDGSRHRFIRNCGIEEFVMPNSLTEIDTELITNCNHLKTIKFSRYFNFNGIRKEAFISCPEITEIYLPIFSTTVSEDSYFVFKNNKIKDGPFLNINDAQRVANNLNTAENTKNYTYKLVEAGKTLVINADTNSGGFDESFVGTTKINNYIFNEVEDYKVIIPDNIEGKNVALYRIADTKVNNDGTATITPIDGKILRLVAKGISNYNVLEDTIIINGAFSHCNHLTACTIPEGVIELQNGAFYECSNLKEIILPSTLNVIGQYSFFNNRSLAKLIILSEHLNMIDNFAINGCLNLSQFIIRSIIAPKLEYDTELESGKYYKYHPFGFRTSSFIGYNTKKIGEGNKLYVPYNNSGYDDSIWLVPLLQDYYGVSGSESETCGFVEELLTLDNMATLKGSVVENYDIIYLKSDSGNFINNGLVESSTPIDGVFNIDFNGKVYDNEPIYIYSDSECTNQIGSFIAKYGKTDYDLNNIILGAVQKTMNIKQNYFGVLKDEKVGDEIVSITKKEYEILQSKINQLMKLLNKKK